MRYSYSTLPDGSESQGYRCSVSCRQQGIHELGQPQHAAAHACVSSLRDRPLLLRQQQHYNGSMFMCPRQLLRPGRTLKQEDLRQTDDKPLGDMNCTAAQEQLETGRGTVVYDVTSPLRQSRDCLASMASPSFSGKWQVPFIKEQELPKTLATLRGPGKSNRSF